MAKYRTSAGSFVLHQNKPKKITTYIHHGKNASCGGGGALSERNITETANHVSVFLARLGWTPKVGQTVKEQLLKMQLSADPTKHAFKLHNYYEGYGIQHRAILEDVEKGKRGVAVQGGNWLDWLFGGEKAACSDARHHVKTKGRFQEEQNPKGFYFGEKPVPKNTHNEVFTIAGVSQEYVKGLLKKVEEHKQLTEWEAHNLAAVSLSAYYYCHHKWPNYAELENLLKK